MRITKRHTLAVLAIAAAASFGLAGCSGSGTTSSDDSMSTSEATTAPEPTMESTPEAMDPASDLVGPGCAAYAEAVPDGAGSVAGMAEDPVATAASNNPLLTTLVAAVSGQLNPDVNLVDTLNGGEFTVFAPVDDAFAKLDPATVETLKTPEGAATLTKVLTYHVIPGQLSPDEIVGTHTTVEGADVTVAGSGDALTVDGSTNVICGGVHTANATVYLIDSVLMPAS
ncbi:fasciclin domain-containing protein [Herbiconiux moechotypicola]|uniref:Cell surface glycolipoprotein Mpt83 n=1 Tax=Herbiconiux moechotypicola TaxID=637393 RepID=A0ABN3E391_9MICO|nr:fasciclin domain-containing protein [Herbiconiux moechotypicola]MCS5731530.1 fasciclin domain-containing protein [Herbiconiux moechotypicola]